MKKLLRLSAMGLVLGVCSPAGLAGLQRNKNKSDDDIAALKKQVQALEEGQQQILQELRELKKLLEARPMPPAAG